MSVSLNEKFYRVIANIPEGRVASYGQVALLAGRPRAARAVGAAPAMFPLIWNSPVTGLSSVTVPFARDLSSAVLVFRNSF